MAMVIVLQRLECNNAAKMTGVRKKVVGRPADPDYDGSVRIG